MGGRQPTGLLPTLNSHDVCVSILPCDFPNGCQMIMPEGDIYNISPTFGYELGQGLSNPWLPQREKKARLNKSLGKEKQETIKKRLESEQKVIGKQLERRVKCNLEEISNHQKKYYEMTRI